MHRSEQFPVTAFYSISLFLSDDTIAYLSWPPLIKLVVKKFSLVVLLRLGGLKSIIYVSPLGIRLNVQSTYADVKLWKMGYLVYKSESRNELFLKGEGEAIT